MRTGRRDLQGAISAILNRGCFIGARLLNRIQRAFTQVPKLVKLLRDPDVSAQSAATVLVWRDVVAKARRAGVACPAIGASPDGYDTRRSARVRANSVQAQRDYFGA